MNYSFESCTLCPRECKADRYTGKGFCGEGTQVRIARAEPHHWEEPPISGKGGAGTVFFTGCTLRCCYCQNYELSHEGKGFELTVRELRDTFLRLIDMGCENIELVSPTQFAPQIIEALDMLDSDRPVTVWNTGGYEKAETLDMLDGYIDIYLPDLKYRDSALSKRYSGASDYFEKALGSVKLMQQQVGRPVYDEKGMLRKGVIVRHLVLPTHRHDSIEVIKALRECFEPEDILLSLMSQYTPCYHAFDYKELTRRTSTFEYESVLKAAEDAGFEGFFQERSSASEDYIPQFFDKKYY